jgi:hypothetical protein
MNSCTGSGPVATFVAADFRALFPAFTNPPFTDPQLQGAFSIATTFLRNDGTSPIRTIALQTQLLYMLTAHVAVLLYGADGTGAGPVGRVSSASEGSVSVSTDFPTNPNSAWYMQTQYGAMYWQATMAMRTANYRPGPTRFGTGIGAGRFRRF